MTAKIILVGEAWGEREERKGCPFVGPSGGLLNAFLSSAGIDRRECYLTNVFNFRPSGNKIETLCGPKDEAIPGMPAIKKSKYVRREFATELVRLANEIKSLEPNIIVALGSSACWALLGNAGIKKVRGAPIIGLHGFKVFPTYHPAAVLREYKLRPIVLSDFKKIRRESLFLEIRRPKREFWIEPEIKDLYDFEKYMLEAEEISIDIETWNGQITCIGFTPSIDRAIVIPFCSRETVDGNYWPDLATEMRAWRVVRKWCNLPQPKIGQNFLYDCRYLWQVYGISVRNVGNDTMLLHHAMQPEMEKSLGFLGTIYTDEPSWKFMRRGSATLKKED